MGLLNYLVPGNKDNPAKIWNWGPGNRSDRGSQPQSYDEANAAWDPNYAWGLHSGSGATEKFAPGARTLFDILNNPGQTDSALFNQSIASNARTTNQRLDASRGSYARSGMQNSGLAAAMQGAITGAGENQKAKLTAEEARRREDLKRQDLQLLYQFILEPEMQRYAADKGVSLGQSQAKAQQNASYAGSAASLIGSLASAFCHVADELYGRGSEDSILSRYYMVKFADDATFDAYSEGSKNLAERIKADSELRVEVKNIFDHYVDVAKQDFPSRFQ